MFDVDLNKIKDKINDHVAYYGQYPEKLFASEDTLELLKFKFKHETGIYTEEYISYLFGVPIEINNTIAFCKVEI